MKHLGLVLCSSVARPLPSTRIAVLNMLPLLREAGMQVTVLFEPDAPTETPRLEGVAARAIEAGCDGVLLQKVHGPDAIELTRQLGVAGIPTVFSVCDLVNPTMVEATQATVIVTDYLRALHPPHLQQRIHVVHDGIERPEMVKQEHSDTHGTPGKPLCAVLVTSMSLSHLPMLGHPPGWLRMRVVGRYARGLQRLREIRWSMAGMGAGERLRFLGFLADRRIACVPWDAEQVYAEMARADMAVIPVDTSEAGPGAGQPPAWKVKSENRLTMKMAMGLPVVTTPIPSYESILEHGRNGFFARTPSDWSACLDALRDPARRREMGAAARASVLQRYSMQEQARRLLRVLDEVTTARG